MGEGKRGKLAKKKAKSKVSDQKDDEDKKIPYIRITMWKYWGQNKIWDAVDFVGG